MKTKLVLLSDVRKTARAAVEKCISDHVFGPVSQLPHEDILELRAVLRAANPFGRTDGWEYKVWLEEIAIALGNKQEREFTKKRVSGYEAADIMPSMREWAKKHGLIRETEPAA
jgi:hypothetical protein